jgi:aerobic carbon-monoxide dehydrogenase medium subunit
MLVGLRSRKHIPPFELVRPANLEQACRAYSEPGRSALMAGGLDLIDRLKGGESVDRIIHLAGIRELSGIQRDGDAISIGALTTHDELARSTMLVDALPDLPAIWRTIANPRVRYAGTVGGNLMSAMPHYDALPAFLSLGAKVLVFDRSGAASTMELGALHSRDDVIFGQIRIEMKSFQRRLLADRSLHPVVSVYVGAEIGDGKVYSTRLAIGCAYAKSVVIELPVVGAPLASLGSDAGELARAAASTLRDPIDDGLASGPYRRRMIEVLTRRLLIKLGSKS